MGGMETAMMRRVVNYGMDEVRYRALDEAHSMLRRAASQYARLDDVLAAFRYHMAKAKERVIYSRDDGEEYSAACAPWFSPTTPAVEEK